MSIPAHLHVIKHTKALQSHQLVLIRLADHANLQGLAWPSVALLMAETGYKRRWVEMALDALVRMGEIIRVKVGRSYRYQLDLYDTEADTCTCAVSAHIIPDADGICADTAEHAHLLPRYAHLLPRYAQYSAPNASGQKGNPAEPVFEPDSEPVYEPGASDVRSHERADTTHPTDRHPQTTEPCHVKGCAEWTGAFSRNFCQRHAVTFARDVYQAGRAHPEYPRACEILRYADALADA